MNMKKLVIVLVTAYIVFTTAITYDTMFRGTAQEQPQPDPQPVSIKNSLSTDSPESVGNGIAIVIVVSSWCAVDQDDPYIEAISTETLKNLLTLSEKMNTGSVKGFESKQIAQNVKQGVARISVAIEDKPEIMNSACNQATFTEINRFLSELSRSIAYFI
jgi:hypothetical protein